MNALRKYSFCFLAGLCAAGGSFFAFLLYQCLPIILMILSNLLNWRYFLKALQMTEQTLTATVLTAASNYVISFILGSLVFKEPLTLLSILGSSFIVLGLWYLCADNHDDKEKTKKT